MKTVSWFSAGVSSAVATRLAIDEIDKIFYIHIEDQHPDTLRFVKDCEAWFGKPITILQSPYKTVENAILQTGGGGYINGPHGASCTRVLKKRVRQEWEAPQLVRLRYVWGMDIAEIERAERLKDAMTGFSHLFPLIDRGLSKTEAHEILKASGIERPAMYELGYHNNNCIGCIRGGLGYWNKIRIDFPDVFEARARLERKIDATCLKGRLFLDELDPDRGRHAPPIVDECGVMCELMALTPHTES